MRAQHYTPESSQARRTQSCGRSKIWFIRDRVCHTNSLSSSRDTSAQCAARKTRTIHLVSVPTLEAKGSCRFPSRLSAAEGRLATSPQKFACPTHGLRSHNGLFKLCASSTHHLQTPSSFSIPSHPIPSHPHHTILLLSPSLATSFSTTTTTNRTHSLH